MAKARIQFYDRENSDYITLVDAEEVDRKIDQDIFNPGWPWVVISVELETATNELLITSIDSTTPAELPDGTPNPAHTRYNRIAVAQADEAVWEYSGSVDMPEVGYQATIDLSDLSTTAPTTILNAGNLVYKDNRLAFVVSVDETAQTAVIEGLIVVKMDAVEHDNTLSGTGLAGDPLGVRITVEGCSIDPDTGDINLGLASNYPWSPLEQIMQSAVLGQQNIRFLAGQSGSITRPSDKAGIAFTLAGTREGSIHFSEDPTSPAVTWQEWPYNNGPVDVYIVLADLNGTIIPGATSGKRVVNFVRTYGDVNYLSNIAQTLIGVQAQAVPTIKDLEDAINNHIADTIPHLQGNERVIWNNTTTGYNAHILDVDNTMPHVSAAERTAWNAVISSLAQHIQDSVRHITATERTAWNNAASLILTHTSDVGQGNNTPHVSQVDRTNWNGKANQTDLNITNTNLSNEAQTREQEDNILLALINGMQSLGRYLGAVDTYAAISSFTLPSSASPNDFITVRADETHSGSVTRYVLTSLGPPPVWNYDFTLNDDTTGKMDKVPTAVTGNLPIFNTVGNVVDSGHTLSEYARQTDMLQTQQNLQNEITRAQGAEQQLANDIESEETRAKQEEQQIASDLADEIARSTGIDTTLTNGLAAEIQRATTAEQSETTLRTDADRNLQNQIDAIKKNGNYQGLYAIQADLPTTNAAMLVGDWAIVVSDNNGVPAIVTITAKNALTNALTWDIAIELAASGQAAKQYLFLRDMVCQGSISGTGTMPDLSTLPIGSYFQIFFDEEEAVMTCIATTYSPCKNLEIWITSNKAQRVGLIAIEHWFSTTAFAEDVYDRGGATHDRTAWIRNFGAGSTLGQNYSTNDAYGVLMSSQEWGEYNISFPDTGTMYYVLIKDTGKYPSGTARIAVSVEVRRSKAPLLMTDQYTKEVHVS